MTTPSPSPRPSFWRSTLAGLLALGVAALGIAGQATAQPASKHASKFDRSLREREKATDDATPLKVIVTLKPGAKRGLVRALKANGARLSDDFSIIEAFAGDLPAGLLRALEQHPDVLTISTDAVVRTSAVATSVSGNAAGGAYNLRRTLGLQADGTAVTRTFQQGLFRAGLSMSWYRVFQ